MKSLLLLALFITVRGQAGCLSGSLDLERGTSKNMLEMESTVEMFGQEIKKELPPGINMVIRLDSMSNRINADIIKDQNQLVVQVFGGMLKHPEMTKEVLQLLLCHELGHFLGGPPLKSRGGWSSTEGQADYYSGTKCANDLGFSDTSFIDAALKLTSIYAEVKNESIPELYICDENEVLRTNYGYPSSQCRLDTLLAGWRGLKRPSCWFYE